MTAVIPLKSTTNHEPLWTKRATSSALSPNNVEILTEKELVVYLLEMKAITPKQTGRRRSSLRRLDLLKILRSRVSSPSFVYQILGSL